MTGAPELSTETTPEGEQIVAPGVQPVTHRDRPDLADWWMAQEAKPGKSSAKGHCPDMRVFRIDREPYARLLDQVERQGVLALSDPDAPEIDWEREECVCTD